MPEDRAYKAEKYQRQARERAERERKSAAERRRRAAQEKARDQRELKQLGFVGASERANERRRTRERIRSEPVGGGDFGAPKRTRKVKDLKPARAGFGIPGGETLARNASRELAAIARGLPKAGYSLVKRSYLDKETRESYGPFAPLAVMLRDQAKYAEEKYGPLLPGGRPASETLERIQREPVSTALDVLGVASVGAGSVARAGRVARTPGGPVTRVRASRALPAPRIVKAGQAEAQFPASPSPVTRAAQRVRDVSSERMGTAAPRVAKERAKQLRTDVRRRQAGFAEDIVTVGRVPKQARAGVFYERQLPASVRGGMGLERVEADLRSRAKAAAEGGDTRMARQQLIQAERVKRSRESPFDPSDALQAIDRLEAERRAIFERAGKLNPATAAKMEADFARKLGFEDV